MLNLSSLSQLRHSTTTVLVLKLGLRHLSSSYRIGSFRSYSSVDDKENTVYSDSVPTKGGFAKSVEKFAVQDDPPKPNEPTFLNLLKNSKFIDLGDPEGKVVIGTIFHVVENDLYVDFGWKFHCVVPRPVKNGEEYVRGAKVRLAVKDLELSTRFLGSEKDLTLLEADATLVGLVYSPARKARSLIS